MLKIPSLNSRCILLLHVKELKINLKSPACDLKISQGT